MDIDLRNNLNADFKYEPIQYHDCWLSIDPIIGCSLSCQYCYLRQANWTGVKPQRVFSAIEITDMLESHRYFIPNKTPLAMGNTTDMFLPGNVEMAVDVAHRLNKNGYTNPLIFITKKRIPLDAIIEFGQMRNIKLIFLLSYSGLPPFIEKGVNPNENRNNFQLLAEHSLPIIHFWRPLIALNWSKEKIEEILDFVVQYATSSIYVGLKHNPTLHKIYKDNENLLLPVKYENQYGEYIPLHIEQRLKRIAARKYPTYSLYRHSSCAISNILNSPEYNATIYNERICVYSSRCPAKQRAICQNAKDIPQKEKVRALLESLGKSLDFQITTKNIEFFGTLDQQDFSFLLHNLNYPIKANVNFTRFWRGRIFSR